MPPLVKISIAGLLFLVLSPWLTTIGQAQPYPVIITIAVAPPYYSHISDYLAQPNKIMATLTNTSSKPVNVYLLGSVTGEGGIKIYTDPSYKMPQALKLNPNTPYQLTQNNIGDVFDANHLIYSGITKNEIIYGNGLPEGDYTICLKAFDYQTNQQVSPEAPQSCSNMFTITDVEPPVVLNPACGEDIYSTTPQNIVINWTRPPGVPFNTYYNLKMVEVLPFDRNINDAMKSATHPVFFESRDDHTSYVFTSFDPALVEGKKYAFSVTVIDPSGKTSFRNNGMSEVCSFNYVKPFSPSKEDSVSGKPK